MVEVLRVHWEFILYEQNGNWILFIVNGHGNLSDVTYTLSKADRLQYEKDGKSFLLAKAQQLRENLIPAGKIDTAF